MNRINSINILRIIFMALILTFHAMVNYNAFTGFMPLDEVISKGAVAVTGFFMISGFTLRLNYADRLKKPEQILRYIKNRILGIFPAYIFLLIVSFLWHFRMQEDPFHAYMMIPVELTMTQTLYYIQMVYFSFNDNFWYVSVAFFLYLIFPALNWVASQVKRPLPWIITLTVFSEYVYWISISRPVIVETYYYINPFFRIPEFFCGILACDLVKKLQGGERVMRTEPETKASVEWKKAICRYLWIPATVVYLALFFKMYLPLLQWQQNYNLFNIIVIPYMTILLVACAYAPAWLEKFSGSLPIKYLAGLGLTMYLCQSIPFAHKEFDYLHVAAFYEQYGPVVMFYVLTILSAVLINALIERPIKWLFRGRKEKRKVAAVQGGGNEVGQ